MLPVVPPFDQSRAFALGITAPLTPFLFRLQRVKNALPEWNTISISDWLVAIANGRGFYAAVPASNLPLASDPGSDVLPNEEIAIGLIHPRLEHRPLAMRLAVQLITRGELDVTRLILLARREASSRILAELARLALRVDAHHPIWRALGQQFSDERPLAAPLIHWSRLAEPISSTGRTADGWRLVA